MFTVEIVYSLFLQPLSWTGEGEGKGEGGIGPVSSGCRDFHILFHRGWCRTSCLGVFTSP